MVNFDLVEQMSTAKLPKIKLPYYYAYQLKVMVHNRKLFLSIEQWKAAEASCRAFFDELDKMYETGKPVEV